MDLLSLVTVPVAAYLLIAAFVAIDAMIPALPGEVLVVSAGALAAAGHLDVVWAVVAATAGAIGGDLAVYGLSRRALPGALSRTRFGRRVVAGIGRAHDRLGSTSAVAIIAARFVPLGRTAVAAAAGIAGLRPRRFAVFALTGCLLWAGWTVGLGYVTGSVTDAPLWLQVAIGTAIGVLVGVWAGAAHTVMRTRRRMSERARSAAVENAPDEPSPSRTPELVC
ncbi:DedA family protein [Jiangella asiatica]|uniref:DedA family protein n=1 Tax=Jiangella asiatica TaxID=2530372 RepID=A0A4V2YZZ6_9ACTN|nr:VTT domain-containing protein [Jiangella asiatica]TDD99057.1 DedA family protein [Jiangella asiatica]